MKIKDTPPTEFERLYNGRLWSVMQWRQLTELWARIDPAAGWYLHAVGFSPVPPQAVPADAARVKAFMEAVDALLHADHHESYCGIVYVDDLEHPRLIKIYDPDRLGSSCGSSKNPIPPGWVMSLLPPDETVGTTRPAAENRKRWWRTLCGDS